MAKAMREQGYNTAKIQREVMKTLRADKDYKRNVAQTTKDYKQYIKSIIRDTVQSAAAAGNKLVGSAGDMAWNDDLRVWKGQNIDLKKPNNLNQLYQAFKAQTKNQLKNITRSTGFKGTLLGTTGVLNMYQRSMDLAVLKLSTGTFSYDQCVKDLIHQLAQSGLRSIDYANGRSYHIDTAARMVVRTASSQLAGKITEMNIEKTGVDLVYVDAHAGARPSHQDWQGQVYSYRGNSKKYPDFYSATDYGSVTGLKGVNCTHNFYPYWEGSPIPAYKEPDPVTVNGKEYTMYEATQEQRKMERGIRATKREIEGLKSVGYDTTDLNKKLNKQTNEYKQFSSAVGIRPQNNRLSISSGTSVYEKTTKKGKIESERQMASGMRRSYLIKLSDEDKNYILSEIKTIEADASKFVFRDYLPTSYYDPEDKIFVSSSVFPSNDGSTHPADVLSVRATLAHEYYGHRQYRNTNIEPGSWNDEFRASYMAAKNCPNLSDQDKRDLIRVAMQRANDAGINIKINSFMRKCLYGYE